MSPQPSSADRAETYLHDSFCLLTVTRDFLLPLAPQLQLLHYVLFDMLTYSIESISTGTHAVAPVVPIQRVSRNVVRGIKGLPTRRQAIDERRDAAVGTSL